MRGAVRGPAARALRGLASTSLELARIGREMLAIPAAVWLAAAELAGTAVLAAWRVATRIALAAYDILLDALEWARRHVRPAYGAAAVCVAAVLALAGSQLVDYRGVAVGAPAYSEVEPVAAAPEVDRQRPDAAHGWAVFPLALAGLAATAIALRGRWRVARLLAPVGLAAVALSLVVDAPHGLDAGSVAVAYEGAEAVLLEGFWAQLVAGAALALGGPLLAWHLRRGGVGAPARRGRGRGRLERPGSSPLAGPPMGTQGTNP